MIVYQETKDTFLNDVYYDKIEDKINEKVIQKLHRHTGLGEFHSWMNSMQYMYKVMQNKSIPKDAHIAIEYQIPNSNKRVDFIITGETSLKKECAVIIELKQWQSIDMVDNQEAIVKTILQGRKQAVSHPSYQAWSYSSMIHDYNEDVRHYNIELHPCAYLHNYRLKQHDPLIDDHYQYFLDKAPVFTRGDTDKLADFISKYIKKGNPDVLYHIEHGKIIPSKSLQDNVASLLNGNQEFVLLDEQKVIYEDLLLMAKNAPKDKKTIAIVHGGPGTGKSVLAINLLSAILNLSQNVMYVSKNAAPRHVYQALLKNGQFSKSFVDHLFKGSGAFTSTFANTFDCLIVDEAHRLNAKSGLFGNLGENQIKEIINASRFSIFFVDDHQMVTLKDIGSTEQIKKWVTYFDASLYENELISQFRCNGSDAYLSWIDNVLEINTKAMTQIPDDYDVQIVDSPKQLFNMIVEKNKINNKARIVAGYCWDWISNGKNNSDVHDILIDDFGISWNLSSSQTWAIDPNSVNEAGCIHTCQGLEFDYVGVIIGKDLTYDDGIITDYTKRASTDQSLKGIKSFAKRDKALAIKKADAIIKNTYRTLMTRGQKGCYIYCCDSHLSNYLKQMLN